MYKKEKPPACDTPAVQTFMACFSESDKLKGIRLQPENCRTF
jgi:hypothetical protein